MCRSRRLTPIAALCAVVAVPAFAQSQRPPAPITPYADLRYRLELVDQQGLPEDAVASTLRARIGVRTAEWHGLSGLIEGDAVMRVGPRHYNDTVNGQTAYPVVADPSDVLLNQAFVRWRPDPAFEATLGRQAINQENQRWIGSVGWRQNDQTLDAAQVTVKPLTGLTLSYFNAWRVNRVFGPDSPQGIWRDTAINAVRAAYAVKGVGTISGYGYWLDIPSQPVNSSRTLGARMTGEQPVGNGTRLLYAAEYARQHDFAGNPRRYALDYVLIEPGIAHGPATLRLGYEHLGGDGAAALQTPLATLHAFNGWADKFLTTPPNGLRDLYVDASIRLGAEGPLRKLLLRAMWHDYRSTRASIAYGSEWNALASYPVTRNLSASIKFARYDARAFATDTTKGWFSIDAQF